MGRIGERFARLRERDEKGLVAFVTGGDPDLHTTGELVQALDRAGADAVEISVPFSDPIADGPTIQRSSERALRGGASLRRILQLVKELRPTVEVPLLLMGYANTFVHMGAEPFARAAAEVGVDGTIVVDLPPEEGEALFAAEEAAGVDPVLLAAPTTTPTRMRRIAERTRGFLYYVSLTGVTGARADLPPDLAAGVRRARAVCPVPVCVGFGISTPALAARGAAHADGVVVGSAFVERIEAAAGPREAVAAVEDLAAALVAALRPGAGSDGR